MGDVGAFLMGDVGAFDALIDTDYKAG